MLSYEVQTTMQDLDLTQHNPDIFNEQKSDLEIAIEVICESKSELNCEWLKQEFDNVAMALKEKEAMQ